jgi:anaphase-promoting complex subunit 5
MEGIPGTRHYIRGLRVELLMSRQIARQGRYLEALAVLLDPDVWRGIEYSQYLLWAAEIWHVLALRASRW